MSDPVTSPLLLEETRIFTPQIVERATPGGRLRLQGIYQLGEVVNQNKRRYPNPLWDRLLGEGSAFQNRVRARRVLGELGHPKDGKTLLERVSHLITKTWIDPNGRRDCLACEQSLNPGHYHVMAEEEVLNTPHGKILGELYEAQVETGVSSRGRGTLVPMGEYSNVNDDYAMETFDHVLDPSTPGAMPRVVSENVVGVISRFANCDATPAELQGYRSILAEVTESAAPEIRSNAHAVMEAIEVRLANASRGQVQCSVPASAPLLHMSDSDSRVESPLAATPTLEARMTITKDLPEVRAIVAEAVREHEASLRTQFDTAMSEMVATVESLQQELLASQQRNEAADLVGNELVSQLKETNLKLTAYSTANSGGHDVLQKFDTAKGVIEELIEHVRSLRYAEARADAAERLLSEVVARTQREHLMAHVDRLLQVVPEEHVGRVKPFLTEASSIAEANRRFSTVTAALITEAPETEQPAAVRTDGALPPTAGHHAAALTESTTLVGTPTQGTQAGQQVNESVNITRAMVRRLSGRTAVGA